MSDLMGALEEVLRDEGVDLFGIADVQGLLTRDSWASRAVVFAIALDPTVITGIASGPTAEYGALYTSINRRLTSIGDRVAETLMMLGYRAENVGASTGDFDPVGLSARFPHKLAATRSGLGWVGKSDLLVTRSFGTAVRFDTVLTDAPLEPGEPVTSSECGKCTACVDTCPASALNGTLWSAGMERESIVDSHACHQQCKKFAEEYGFEHPMCGMCIAACPRTKRYVRHGGKG